MINLDYHRKPFSLKRNRNEIIRFSIISYISKYYKRINKIILTIMYDVQYNAIRGDEMDSMENIINTLTVELKRGSLVLIVLSQLRENEYGYSLVQKLEEKNVPIEAGTLYPLLRRLEKQNLLVSEWDTSESRPRKFYKLSNLGEEVFVRLKNEWILLSKQLDIVLKENNGYEND